MLASADIDQLARSRAALRVDGPAGELINYSNDDQNYKDEKSEHERETILTQIGVRAASDARRSSSS